MLWSKRFMCWLGPCVTAIALSIESATKTGHDLSWPNHLSVHEGEKLRTNASP